MKTLICIYLKHQIHTVLDVFFFFSFGTGGGVVSSKEKKNGGEERVMTRSLINYQGVK